jgi:hypothetical protein
VLNLGEDLSNLEILLVLAVLAVGGYFAYTIYEGIFGSSPSSLASQQAAASNATDDLGVAAAAQDVTEAVGSMFSGPSNDLANSAQYSSALAGGGN